MRHEVRNRSARAGLPWRVEMRPLRGLRPAHRNARTHSKKQIRQIADSIERFGIINPIIVDERGRIVAGHARADAANLVGLKHVPIIRLSHLSEAEIRAYMLADNKLAEKAGWDREILNLELEELQVALPEVGLDLTITGFEPAEVDAIMTDFGDDCADPAEEFPELEDTAVPRKGDLFILGKHRLIVGDARDAQAYVHLMQAQTATVGFLDPPYNVKIDGHAGGRGRIKHREFACASGEMSPEQYIGFLHESFSGCARNTIDGGIIFVCIDWRHVCELLEAGAKVFDELKNICVWAKTSPGQGSFYRSQHELVFVYKRGQTCGGLRLVRAAAVH